MDFADAFEQALSYNAFLDRYASAQDRRRWDEVYERVRLSDAQRELLAGFVREMKVLVLAGAWCGDCVEQCPIFARFAEATGKIQLRFCDRDDSGELADALTLCGGHRVPVVVFLSEDGYECGRYGDRTLSKYRRMAGEVMGAACPSGIVSDDDSLLEAVTQEWLNEFERIQWMLRTSTRLRQRHGD